MSLPEVSFADSAWVSPYPSHRAQCGTRNAKTQAWLESSWLLLQHCVAIVHVPGRRLFSQNLVSVYKDGHLVKTAPLHFPSLSEVC